MKSKYVNQSYNKAMSLLAFCLCLVLAFALFLPTTITYADYADLNDNTIVNFNQYFTDTYTHNYNLSSGANYPTNFIIQNGHSYFIKIDVSLQNNARCSLEYALASNDYTTIADFYESGIYYYLFVSQRDNARIDIYLRNTTGVLNNGYLIDLTQMFGENNIPSLQECKDLFVADYYNYTTGTNMPLSKSYLQGYNDGANAVYDAMTITFNSYTIGNNSQTYGNNSIERGTLYFDNIYSAYTFTGVISINMLSNITRGTNINVNFKLWIPDLQGEPSSYASTFKLYFGYVNDNNELIQIAVIEPIPLTASQENTYQGDFVLPIDTQNIYCWVDYNTIGDNFTPTTIIAYQTEMSFKSVDIGLLINNAYNNGASATTREYEPGGIRYESIYQLGVANGVAQGSAFGNGLEIIGTTFTQVFSFFNIEILPGIPLTIFILLPLLVGLIIFIVKMTKGD